MRRSLCDSGR